MNILFTGASSFTGYWFIKELTNANHQVYATLQNTHDSYTGLKKQRINLLKDCCELIEDVSFGDRKFIEIIRESSFDVLCHHGSYVKDYKSLEFDVLNAVRSNSNSVSEVLNHLTRSECTNFILTGSVFESNEGIGSHPIAAFSPYGLSKSITSEIFKYWSRYYGIRFGKFVIPNPFGPYEQHRFTHYLVKCWFNNEVASVRTPNYIRDNIHVSLLAKSYVKFVEKIGTSELQSKFNPSGYVGSLGEFSYLFAKQMRSRLDLKCQLDFQSHTEFTEPKVRMNFDLLDADELNWRESSAWDELADYYLNRKQEFLQD